MVDHIPNPEATFGHGGDYHRILANVALYLITGRSSLAGTFTFQREHRIPDLGYAGIESYRTAALSNVDKLAMEELAQFIKIEAPTGSKNLDENDLFSVAKELMTREILEEKLEGRTYYLKARLVADPEEISKAVNLVQELDDKIEQLNKARLQAEEALKEVQRLEQEVKLAKIKAVIGEGTGGEPAEEHEEIKESFKKAKELFSLRDYHGAIEIYTSLIEQHKQEVEALLYRGAAHFYLGDYEKAVADYNRAIELDPFSAVAYHNRASSKVKMGQIKEGIEDYSRALELEESYADAYRNRGVTYLRYVGDYERALEDFDRLVNLRPEDMNAYFLRGTTLGKMGRYEEAYSDYLKAAQGLQDDPWLHYNTGNCLLKMGRYREAVESYSKAIELNPDIPLFYHNRGLAHAREGLLQEALKDYNRALALGLEDAKSLVIRGFLLWKTGDKEMARRDWERAAELGETRGVEFLERVEG